MDNGDIEKGTWKGGLSKSHLYSRTKNPLLEGGWMASLGEVIVCQPQGLQLDKLGAEPCQGILPVPGFHAGQTG